jgi:hypothetical protein
MSEKPVEVRTVTESQDRQRYREHLMAADRKSVELFDNTVISLSGGALGVSVLILERVTERLDKVQAAIDHGWLMPVAWACWAASVASCLLSHYFSHLSLRRAIAQLDRGEKIVRAGGWLAWVTDGCTIIAGILFLGGLIAAGLFVWKNVNGV